MMWIAGPKKMTWDLFILLETKVHVLGTWIKNGNMS